MSAILKNPLLRLRTMEQEDLEQVMDIEELCYSHPWTHGIFSDCLRVGYCCWVMELDGDIIGYGVMSVAAGEAHILNICILPDFQGRGLGRKILARLLLLAKDHNVDTVFLEVRINNRVAQVLYESEGFNEIGQRHGYYPAENGREDALVFAKVL
ncbi:MAG: ribosomal protein S18-alanine N-acetyltransferase [Gammaproteobacteria bacterium]|nr:ribosomal protein S18-alanine N-acetyltransferase [Gammaproteobacteria bacterium]